MIQKFKQKKFARQMLTSLYGINTCTANKIIGLLALHPLSLSRELSRRKYSEPLGQILDSLRIGFRLRLIIFSRICLHVFIKSYRGIRLLQGLPTKGQRTHANGKTTRRLKTSGANFPFKIKAVVTHAINRRAYKFLKKFGED
jgi:small subunit ribosomal protein S13